MQYKKQLTHHQQENTLESGADKNEDTGAKDDGSRNLFNNFQSGFPNHGDWNENKVWVSEEVCSEGDSDNWLGNSWLAYV